MKILEHSPSPEEQDELYLPLMPDIYDEAEKGYDPRLDYHSWPHGVFVKDRSLEIRDQLILAGAKNVPGIFTTVTSALMHDYDYRLFQWQKRNGTNKHPSAEAMAVSKTTDLLTRFGVDPITIEQTVDPIWGTMLGQRCHTLGRFTLCVADLDNTAADYETEFKPKTEDLRRETEWLGDKSIDPLAFASGSLVVLTRYHFENLGVFRLLRQHTVYLDFFKRQAENLRLLGLEVVSGAGVVGEEAVQSFFQKMGDQVARLCLNKQDQDADTL